MKKFFLASIFIFIVAVPQSLHAQWAKLYWGSENDRANSVQPTSDGGYIIAGYTESFGEGLSDIWVLKLSFAGNIEWQRTYGGIQDEEAYSIQETSDGGYIVAGYTESFGLGNSDIWVLKLTSEGDIEWQSTFGGSGDDWANSVQQTDDGGYIIGGSSNSFGNGEVDFLVVKVSSLGTVEWQNIYTAFVNSYLRSIQEISDGGYIAAGHISPSLNNSFDLLILKLDSVGRIDWDRCYGGSQDDWANAIQETDDGGYFIFGYTKSFGAGNWDFWALKLTSAGNIAWERAYGGSGDDWANSALQTSDGGFIVAGTSDSFGAGLSDFWLLKLLSSGDIEWQTSYGDTGEEAAFSIQQTDDDLGYVVAGITDSYSAGDLDVLVLKLDSDGAIDPSCPLPETSSATMASTGATFRETYMSSWDTSIVPQITDVVPLESSSDTYLVCEKRLEISGSVKTEGDVGIEGVTITFSGGEGEATTDEDGNYSHSVGYGWSGTATPSKAGYGFTPSSREYSEITSGRIDEDYTGFIAHIISGFVRTGGGEGIEDVTITFSNDGGEVLTAADGSYSHAVKEGWSGTATPAKNCYSFTPPSQDYTNVSSDHTNQDYTGTILTYKISGTIRVASTSAPLSGVVMSGLPGNPVTDASGYYEATVDCGWSGRVIPTLLRTVFDPESRDYGKVQSDSLNQDYTAYPGWIISGIVSTAGGEGMAGVTITFSAEGAATTGGDGSYSHTVLDGWSGTATPSKTGYAFTPSSFVYSTVNSDIPDQDYTGELVTYTLTIIANEGGTTQPAPGSYTYTHGTEIDIKALPDKGYDFSRWAGDVFSGLKKVNPVLVIMNSDKSITAHFEKQKLCFIATSAYGTPSHPHVRILRDFRDRYLVRSHIGRRVIELYYRHSPLVADVISRHIFLRIAARIHLLPFVSLSYFALRFGPGIAAGMLFLVFMFPLFPVFFQNRKKSRFST